MLARLLVILLLVFWVSCSGPSHLATFPSLANQGQLALSTTNPYLGSNLFLSKELEQSRYFYNFFKGRGAPTAIEIVEKSDQPTRVLLFYPKDKEVYAADMQFSKDLSDRQWIVRGPYAISRQDFKNLMRMQAAMNGEPVFVIRGKQERFGLERDEPRRVLVPVMPPVPTHTPKPRFVRVPKSEVTPDAKDWRPLNSDQQALMMAKGFAERAENGDLIHTVLTADETLADIVKWYTSKETNLREILTYNSLTADQPVTVGQRIRIPLRLVKEFKAKPL